MALNRNRDGGQRNREEKWARDERSETVYRSDRNRNRASAYKGGESEQRASGYKVSETKERSTNFEERPPAKKVEESVSTKVDSSEQRENPEKSGASASGGFEENPGKDSERKSGKSYLNKRRERQQEREERAAKEE